MKGLVTAKILCLSFVPLNKFFLFQQKTPLLAGNTMTVKPFCQRVIWR